MSTPPPIYGMPEWKPAPKGVKRAVLGFGGVVMISLMLAAAFWAVECTTDKPARELFRTPIKESLQRQ